jgi:GAF domain-containing protein
MSDLHEIVSGLEALISGVPHRIANLANAAAYIYNTFDDISWAGFYILENGVLVLGPFQGKPACIEIMPGKGVCGAAVQTKTTQVVYNVHEFPGHIACDPDSRSETVVPLYKDGAIYGVLDLDSKTVGRFTDEDKTVFESLAAVIEKAL